MVFRKPSQHEIMKVYKHYDDTIHTPVGGVIFDVIFLIVILCCLGTVVKKEYWILALFLIVLVSTLAVLIGVAVMEYKNLKKVKTGDFEIATVLIKAVKFNGMFTENSKILDLALVTDTDEHLEGKLICTSGMSFGVLEESEEFYVIKGLDYFDGQLVFLKVEERNED